MCLEDKGNDTTARMLQERRVMHCTAYWRERGDGRGRKKKQPDPYKWKSTTIAKILSLQEYCGEVVNFKTYFKSFKNKARLENPRKTGPFSRTGMNPLSTGIPSRGCRS